MLDKLMTPYYWKFEVVRPTKFQVKIIFIYCFLINFEAPS